MAGRPHVTATVSDWELAELAHYRRCGWSLWELACHYGVTERTVSRWLRRMRADATRADSRPAVVQNE